MFSYRCPACGKQHQVDSPLERPFDAPCLRCREIVHVTEELASVSGGTLVRTKPGAVSRTPSAERVQSASARTAHSAAEPAGDASREDIDDPGALGKRHDADWADQQGTNDTSQSQTNPQAAGGDDPETTQAKGAKRKSKSKDEPEALTPLQRGRRRWLVITGVGVLVLTLLGGGGYLGYERYRKSKAGETAETKEGGKASTKTTITTGQTKLAAASKATTSTPSKADATAKDKPKTGSSKTSAASSGKSGAKKEATPDKLEPVEPVVKARDDKVIRISAARLSAELAADPGATNEKYKGALLEVSGIYEKTENRETVRPPLRPHMIFATAGPPILGDQLGSRTDPGRWRTLTQMRPCTIRGVYGADGVLHGSDLMAPSPPADQFYKGKDLEVSGFVADVVAIDAANPFPRLILEGETQSSTRVECLFRATDRERVAEVAVETPVVIRGTCSGRFFEGSTQRYVVRFDNCDLIFTSAPPADRQRIDAARLLRAYDEDLRTTLMPALSEERRMEGTISVSQLESELAANPKEFEQKYRDQIVTVTGASDPRGRGSNQLMLVTGDTNPTLRVRCRFTPRVFKELDKGPSFVIRGFCTGLADPKTLVLENCEPLDSSGRRDVRRLVADFLPHTPGRSLTYDLTQPSPLGGKPRVMRMIFEQKERGVVETVTTHVGTLRGASLFDPEEKNGAWTKSGSVRKVRLPGPSLRHRVGGGFVYVGTYESQRANESELVWQPALKLGARTGETWSWSRANTQHEYTLVKFDTYHGQPSAIVRETITMGKDPHHPGEIEHVYVKGVGEVERREVQRLTSKEQRLVSELKLVDEPRPAPDPKQARPGEAGGRVATPE
jgi:hypothetical protein